MIATYYAEYETGPHATVAYLSFTMEHDPRHNAVYHEREAFKRARTELELRRERDARLLAVREVKSDVQA